MAARQSISFHRETTTCSSMPRGLGKNQSVSVSNDATIELKVLGVTDIALVLAVLAILIAGVLLLGLRIRRRRRHAEAQGR